MKKNGEKIKINEIRIPEYMKPISNRKFRIKMKYYNEFGYFRDDIILDKNNNLVDGYSSYLLANILGMKNVIIKREGGKLNFFY